MIRILVAFALAAAAAPAHAQEAHPHPLAGYPWDTLSAARERPLFAPDRRPPAPPAAMARVVAAPPAPPELELIGIVRVGENAIAIANDREAGTTVSLEVDDAVGDWTVTAIEPSRLVLRLGEAETSFTLFTPGRAPTAAAGPSPPGGAENGAASLSDASGETLLKILRGEITLSEP